MIVGFTFHLHSLLLFLAKYVIVVTQAQVICLIHMYIQA